MLLDISNPQSLLSLMVSAADLPEDVLQAIQRSLPLLSYVRFSAVCTSWRSAAAQNPHRPQDYESPWLFSLRGGKVVAVRISPKNNGPPHFAYKKEIPEDFRGHHLVIACLEDNNSSSSILIEHQPRRDGIHLVTNPFSSSWTSTRVLPSLSRSKIGVKDIVKIVTQGDTAVAIAGALSGELAYTTRRFDHWILPDEMIELGGFVDLVLRKEEGLFYALSNACDKVLSLSFRPSSEIHGNVNDDVTIQNMTLNLGLGRLPRAKEHPGWCCFQDGRLVDSPSGFFLVRWRMFYKRGEPTEREIDVFKLLTDSAGEKNWVLVDSLDDKYSFFLGNHQSLVVSTEDFPELKSNCIYVPNDAAFIIEYGSFKIDGYLDEVDYNLIYNMTDKKWDYWDDHEGWDDRAADVWPAVWMMPPPLGQPSLKRIREESPQVKTKAPTSGSSESSDVTMS